MLFLASYSTVMRKRKHTLLQFYIFIEHGLNNSCVVLVSFYKQTHTLNRKTQQFQYEVIFSPKSNIQKPDVKQILYTL